MSAAHNEAPTDPIEVLPSGPLLVLPRPPEMSVGDGGEASYVVTFRDSSSSEHVLTLSFTSYPIAVTAVVLDGKNVPRGSSWARLGRRLVAAYVQPNNVTILLRCFGGDAGDDCFR